MDILDKVINERKLILNEFDTLEEMKHNVAVLEDKLKAYGSKEEIIKDIEDLEALKQPAPQVELPCEEDVIYENQEQLEEEPLPEE